MRYWKKVVVGGAAMLISTGAAHAGQEPTAGQRDRGMNAPGQEASGDANGGAAPGAARARTGVAATGDAAGYVTHDELDKLSKQLIERVERARNGQSAAPTFTDAG